MTMPHLMNCGHSPDSWCLDCVREMHDELEEAQAEIERLSAENLALLKDRKVLHDAVNGICYTIEKNNEQSGFWGVASAHGLIRSKCIDAMEKVREAPERTTP